MEPMRLARNVPCGHSQVPRPGGQKFEDESREGVIGTYLPALRDPVSYDYKHRKMAVQVTGSWKK